MDKNILKNATPGMVFMFNGDAFLSASWVKDIGKKHGLNDSEAQTLGINTVRAILAGDLLKKEMSPEEVVMFTSMGFTPPLDPMFIIARLADLVLRDKAQTSNHGNRKELLIPVVLHNRGLMPQGSVWTEQPREQVLSSKHFVQEAAFSEAEAQYHFVDVTLDDLMAEDTNFLPPKKFLMLPLQWRDQDVPPQHLGKVIEMTRNHHWLPAVVVATEEQKVETRAQFIPSLIILVRPDSKFFGRASLFDLESFDWNSTPMGKASLENLAKKQPHLMEGVDIKGVHLRSSKRPTLRDLFVQHGSLTDEQALSRGRPGNFQRPTLQEGDTWVEGVDPTPEGSWVEHLAKNAEGHFVNYRATPRGNILERVVHDGKFNLERPSLRFTTEKWRNVDAVVEQGLVVHLSVDEQTNKSFRYICRHDGKLLGVHEITKATLKGVEASPKPTNLQGDRGVSVDVYPDDYVPVDEEGTDAEIIIGQDSVDKRVATPEGEKRLAFMNDLFEKGTKVVGTLTPIDKPTTPSAKASMLLLELNAMMNEPGNEEMLDLLGHFLKEAGVSSDRLADVTVEQLASVWDRVINELDTVEEFMENGNTVKGVQPEGHTPEIEPQDPIPFVRGFLTTFKPLK